MRNILLFVLFANLWYSIISVFQDDAELIMLSVVFKHGNQSAINYTFPNDPYKDVNFELPPNTLTEVGKDVSKDLGARLLTEYKEFTESCTPENIEIFTSRIRKCEQTLENVVSTLFPTISYNDLFIQSENPRDDKLLATHLGCSKHIMDRQNYIVHHPSQLEELSELTECMGFKIENYMDVYYLFTYIKSLVEQNYDLPECMYYANFHYFYWYSGVFWSTLVDKQGANAAGNLLQKIAQDSINAPNGSIKKIHIYSGHDINFVGLLGLLENYYGNYENYCPYLAFEVYTSSRGNFVKVVMDFNEVWGRSVIQIPNCEEECPLEDFLKFADERYLGDLWCK